MRRIIKLSVLACLMALLLSGCVDLSALDDTSYDPDATPVPTLGPLTAPVFTDQEALYRLYNEVNIGDMLSDLTEKYGEPKIEQDENGNTYIWADEDGYGFAAVFYENGRMRAKVLKYDDLRQLKELSGATNMGNVTALTRQYDFTMVCMALGGKPMEIAAIAQDGSVNPEVKRVFSWVAENGDCAQILFSAQEKLEQVSYSMAEG